MLTGGAHIPAQAAVEEKRGKHKKHNCQNESGEHHPGGGAAGQCLGGDGGHEGDRHDPGQDGADPIRVNGDGIAAHIVEGAENPGQWGTQVIKHAGFED